MAEVFRDRPLSKLGRRAHVCGVMLSPPESGDELVYFPYIAKIDGDVIDEAIEFMRLNMADMEKHVEVGIKTIREDEFHVDNPFTGETRAKKIAVREETLRWLREL